MDFPVTGFWKQNLMRRDTMGNKILMLLSAVLITPMLSTNSALAAKNRGDQGKTLARSQTEGGSQGGSTREKIESEIEKRGRSSGQPYKEQSQGGTRGESGMGGTGTRGSEGTGGTGTRGSEGTGGTGGRGGEEMGGTGGRSGEGTGGAGGRGSEEEMGSPGTRPRGGTGIEGGSGGDTSGGSGAGTGGGTSGRGGAGGTSGGGMGGGDMER
jgi:hypothetical protein